MRDRGGHARVLGYLQTAGNYFLTQLEANAQTAVNLILHTIKLTRNKYSVVARKSTMHCT